MEARESILKSEKLGDFQDYIPSLSLTRAIQPHSIMFWNFL